MQLPELERLRAALDQRNARIIEIEDDNEFQRKVIGEQEDKIETLAAELAEAREGRWPDIANVLNGYVAALAQAQSRLSELAAQRPATMRQALELLTNGFKYSTEVVTIARAALGITAETEPKP